jgi:hypothetical protein
VILAQSTIGPIDDLAGPTTGQTKNSVILAESTISPINDSTILAKPTTDCIHDSLILAESSLISASATINDGKSRRLSN